MRAHVASVVVFAALVGCGAGPAPDGGTGGGVGGGAGGSGGGSAGGAGGGAAVETISITVVETFEGKPLPNASIRLSGPNAIGQGKTDAAGVALIALPLNERPLDITVAKAGYGAVSVLGVDGTPPARMRIDALAPTNYTMASASGAITGKQSLSHEAVVDAYMFNTFRGLMGSYSATYATNAALPLDLVALELDFSGNVVNHTSSQPFTRGGNITWDAAFPATPANVRAADHTVQFPTQGLLVLPFEVAGPVQVSKQAPDGSGNWIQTGSTTKVVPGASTVPLHLTSADGQWLPDRAYLTMGQQTAKLFLNVVFHDPMDNPRTLTLPQVDALKVTGTTLANVSANATAAAGFDVLELSVGWSATQEVPSWRVYTMKGKPFSISALPNLPSGITPADLGVTSQVEALAMLIAYENPAFLPWMTQPSEHAQPVYKYTLSNGYLQIAPTWR